MGDILGNQKIKKSKNQILDNIKQELFKIDNRGYTTGFLLGNESLNREEFKTSKDRSDWEFVGEVIDVKISSLPEGGLWGAGVKQRNQENKKSRNQIIYIRPHNALNAGELVEIITPKETYKIKIKEFLDKAGNILKEIHGGTKNIYSIELPVGYDIVEMSMLRKRKAKS